MTMVLYRNESCFGSEERDAVEVIRYELCTLGNTDILEYCMDNYNIPKSLGNRISDLIDIIESDDEDVIDMMDTSEVIDIITKLLDVVSRQVGFKIKYVLWLADKKTVKEFYDGNDNNITAYECSIAVLSDLGSDGKLFGYEKNPQPIVESFGEYIK